MILKFQKGGGALPPLVSYLPVMVPTKAPTANAATLVLQESNKLTGLLDDNILKLLGNLEGLPNDTNLVINSLQNFLIDLKYNPTSLESTYLSLINLINNIKFNRKSYDEAFKIANNTGGINEFAINDRGLIFCINNEHDYKLLTPEELIKQKEYAPITTSELLSIRAYSADLAMNNNVLKVIQNSVGMKSINELIEKIISGIGTNTNSLEGYFDTKSGDIVSGLLSFFQAIKLASGNQKYDGTIEDLYKYKFLDKNQAKLAKEAIMYIYKTLPENAKSLLKVKSGTYDNKGAYSLIESLISSKLDPTLELDLDLIGGKTAKKISKDTGSGKDSSDLKTSLPLNIMKGIGGYDSFMTIDPGNGILMNLLGSYYQQIKDTKGNPIINTSLENMLANSGLLQIIKNTRNITFGDLRLTPELLHNITYNNTGLIRANLPIHSDGSINLDILEAYEQAEQDIKLAGNNITKEQMSKIYKQYNLDELLNSDGSLDASKFAPFIVTEGYATENNGIKDSDYVKKIKNPTDQLIKLIKDSLTVGTGQDKEVPYIDTFSWYNPFDWFGVEDIYKAAIYIPITNNVNAAVIGANQELDYDEATLQELKYKNFLKLKSMKSTSADLL